jgi:hypothetical protein
MLSSHQVEELVDKRVISRRNRDSKIVENGKESRFVTWTPGPARVSTGGGEEGAVNVEDDGPDVWEAGKDRIAGRGSRCNLPGEFPDDVSGVRIHLQERRK